MTREEIIADERYHTCGRCKYENVPENGYPCSKCIYGTDLRTDKWEIKENQK